MLPRAVRDRDFELVRDYGTHCRAYYGTGPNSELYRFLDATKPLTDLYRETSVVEFGPTQFKAVRDAMIDRGWARSTINAQMKRIVRMFKWAAAEGKIPPVVFETLRLIPGLKLGRTHAREAAPILPVDEMIVTETCKELPKVLADMVRVQTLIGCGLLRFAF